MGTARSCYLSIEPKTRPRRLSRKVPATSNIGLLAAMLWGASLISVLFLGACAAPGDRIRDLAHRRGFTTYELEGEGFVHRAYASTPTHDAGPLWIFIEGDGRPWINGGREPATDPTTRNPVALHLATRTQARVLYLGRPCYDGHAQDAGCEPRHWTAARYSHQIVSSLHAAVRRHCAVQSCTDVVLVGYSGGGALAVLLARELQSVRGVITIAANLDIDAWTQHHGYLPLRASINPADATHSHPWREIHLIGVHDEIVPHAVIQKYLKKHPQAQVWEYESFDHVCCWIEEWPAIHQRIEKALAE
jgi:hypothetical protein